MPLGGGGGGVQIGTKYKDHQLTVNVQRDQEHSALIIGNKRRIRIRCSRFIVRSCMSIADTTKLDAPTKLVKTNLKAIMQNKG